MSDPRTKCCPCVPTYNVALARMHEINDRLVARVKVLEEALELILHSGHDLPGSLFEPMDDERSVVDIANSALAAKENK